jgi:ABC-type sugar transport system ATPase subunit
MSGISCANVSKRFGLTVAVDRLSMEARPGERLILFGPSGCGKTTLIRMVAGLETPDHGQILIGDRLAADSGRNLLGPEVRDVGLVFQDLALWSHLDVRGHLDFCLSARGVPKRDRAARIAGTLAMVQLAGVARQRPGQLSGGQQQRVALARALVTRPSILLMDEPFASLDVALRMSIREELLRLHRQLRFTLLYVTHDLDEALAIGERVIWFQGRDGVRDLPIREFATQIEAWLRTLQPGRQNHRAADRPHPNSSSPAHSMNREELNSTDEKEE